MKVSTKGRYGIRALVDLAVYGCKNHVTLRSIAERQNISESYLERLIAELRKAGIVKSIRGAYGGYKLSQSPDRIIIGEVLRVLEGSLAPVDCVIENNTEKCKNHEDCMTRILWKKIRDSINGVIDKMTLQDLIDIYEKENEV